MLTSKRQEWILEMIKGPDIAPVSNRPGHYTSKSTISITADDQQVTIGPADVLDLSSPEFLTVQTEDDRQYRIYWERITSLDFDEEGFVAPVSRFQLRTIANRMLPFTVGKKL